MENESDGELSLAFERKGGRLRVKLEDAVPRVKLRGVSYAVTEAPSVMIGGRKHFVEEIV
ncbi:Uncharacterised protein [uncultured archaeon]|nr:Uncharacterised protein [uncultured archaeon]